MIRHCVTVAYACRTSRVLVLCFRVLRQTSTAFAPKCGSHTCGRLTSGAKACTRGWASQTVPQTPEWKISRMPTPEAGSSPLPPSVRRNSPSVPASQVQNLTAYRLATKLCTFPCIRMLSPSPKKSVHSVPVQPAGSPALHMAVLRAFASECHMSQTCGPHQRLSLLERVAASVSQVSSRII